MSELFYKEEVYTIAGAMFEVYKTLGTGFLEPVYQEALAVEFTNRSIPFEREKPLELYYKQVLLEKKYCPDFVCFGEIILELKVLPKLTNIEAAQNWASWQILDRRRIWNGSVTFYRFLI